MCVMVVSVFVCGKPRKSKEVSVFVYGALRTSVRANYQDGQVLKPQKCRKSVQSKIVVCTKEIICY